jgi:hypothetical protein
MNSGMIRDAVQTEQLVEAQAKENLQERFLGASLRFATNYPIERRLPAGYAINEFLQEGAIRRRQRDTSQGLFQNSFQPLTGAAVPLQDADGNFSWFLEAHRVIMPVASLQSSF